MYEHNEYTSQFQPAIDVSSSNAGMPHDGSFDNSIITTTPMEYTAVTTFEPQPPYGSGSSEEYGSYPLNQYPQGWVPAGPSSIDAQSHLYQVPQSDGIPLTTWPSLQHSNNSKESSSEEPISEDRSPDGHDPNQKKQERKERRRAQNRVAQRLFRARREVTLKESSARLENLEDEVGRLSIHNEGLSDTISQLQFEIERLRRENVSLKRRLSGPVDEETELAINTPSILTEDSDNEDESRQRKDRLSQDNTSTSEISRRRTRSKKQQAQEAKQELESIPGKFAQALDL